MKPGVVSSVVRVGCQLCFETFEEMQKVNGGNLSLGLPVLLCCGGTCSDSPDPFASL